ncbi:hypothetical protein [Phytohabitans flavus]|uniref:hypothetical protein n=1 Tax=Phytohabitans flavus TaxID=1076124 RepID=UPI001E294E46|nr:hypothetical protein [Phytohabitans flavus]
MLTSTTRLPPGRVSATSARALCPDAPNSSAVLTCAVPVTPTLPLFVAVYLTSMVPGEKGFHERW